MSTLVLELQEEVITLVDSQKDLCTISRACGDFQILSERRIYSHLWFEEGGGFGGPPNLAKTVRALKSVLSSPRRASYIRIMDLKAEVPVFKKAFLRLVAAVLNRATCLRSLTLHLITEKDYERIPVIITPLLFKTSFQLVELSLPGSGGPKEKFLPKFLGRQNGIRLLSLKTFSNEIRKLLVEDDGFLPNLEVANVRDKKGVPDFKKRRVSSMWVLTGLTGAFATTMKAADFKPPLQAIQAHEGILVTLYTLISFASTLEVIQSRRDFNLENIGDLREAPSFAQVLSRYTSLNSIEFSIGYDRFIEGVYDSTKSFNDNREPIPAKEMEIIFRDVHTVCEDFLKCCPKLETMFLRFHVTLMDAPQNRLPQGGFRTSSKVLYLKFTKMGRGSGSMVRIPIEKVEKQFAIYEKAVEGIMEGWVARKEVIPRRTRRIHEDV